MKAQSREEFVGAYQYHTASLKHLSDTLPLDDLPALFNAINEIERLTEVAADKLDLPLTTADALDAKIARVK